MPPGQPDLDRALDKIRPVLESAYTDWYTGVALRQPDGPGSSVQSALLVYRVPHPALDDAVRALVPTTKVIFIDTKYTAKQIQDFQNRISFGYWRDRGLMINTVGCDFDGRCTIGVDDPDKWRAALQAEYGADRVIVVKQSPVVPL